MRTWKRREFVRTLGWGAAALASPGCGRRGGVAPDTGLHGHPNVLFISVDDLNDWIEPLGGHPQARTPNLKRFATEAVNFTRN